MVPFLVRFPSARFGYLSEVILYSELPVGRMFSLVQWVSLPEYFAKVLSEPEHAALVAGSWPVRTSVLWVHVVVGVDLAWGFQPVY